MDAKKIMKIFEDTAYVRMGGSDEELRAAKYLQSLCAEFGGEAQIVPFDVDMATIEQAEFYADGISDVNRAVKMILLRNYNCTVNTEYLLCSVHTVVG